MLSIYKMITSASRAVDLGLIPESSQTNDWKIGIDTFPAWRSALKGRVKNKPASLLVVPLRRARSGIPRSWCGR